jgi:4-diphosphocytidyl-2-C-methyl-D-erythritol kinase
VSLKKKAFAKINLFLYVTGKRSDGLHELNSLMAQIDLWDEMEFSFEGSCIRISCDHPFVPENGTNLAYKAADLFFDSYRKRTGVLPLEGVFIKIKKKIPVGGGLGGGSSNAAMVLITLNEYCSNFFSRQELMDLGLSLGADVPFFIFGMPALATGVGEKLKKYPDLPGWYLVLCDPGVLASTPDVFKNMNFRLTSKRNYNINSGLNALSRGRGCEKRGKLHNDLEGSACQLYPGIRAAKEQMEFLLKKDVCMSGSGSSLFALFSGQEDARKAYELLRKKWSMGSKKIFLTSLKR